MVKTNQQKIVRCACYTRKSHEVDVDQNFNSLEIQRLDVPAAALR